MRAVCVSHAAILSSNRRIYRTLAARGVDVTLVIPQRWRSGLGPLRAEPEPEGSGINVVVRPRRGISHSNAYWIGGGLDNLIGDQPTAIYVDEDPAGFAAAQGAAAARKGSGLVVLGIQNIFKRYPPPFEALQRYVFKRAGAAVSVTEQAANTLRRRGYAGPQRIMPFATDLEPLSESERGAVRQKLGVHGTVAGYVGRLVPEKGVDIFLRAVAQNDGVNALIVGDGPEREKLQKLAAELGITGRVTFAGILTGADAAKAIGALDSLVLPSLTMRNWSEQFGRVLVEAMASAVPVVTSDSGAIPEVVGDAAIVVPEGDVDGFAAGLRAALEPLRAGDLIRRGRDRVARYYSRDAEATALHEALSAALESGGHR